MSLLPFEEKENSWSESIKPEYETGFSELMSLECIDNFSSESAQLCLLCLQKLQKRPLLKPDGGDG